MLNCQIKTVSGKGFLDKDSLEKRRGVMEGKWQNKMMGLWETKNPLSSAKCIGLHPTLLISRVGCIALMAQRFVFNCHHMQLEEH